MSYRGFAIGLGVAVVFICVVVIGNARISIHAGGDTGICASYFNGPSGDVCNADALQQKLSLDGLVGKHYTGPSVDDLCINERDQRGTCTGNEGLSGCSRATGARHADVRRYRHSRQPEGQLRVACAVLG